MMNASTRAAMCSTFVLVLLAILRLLGGAVGQPPLYKDATQPVEARVEDLLGRMNVQEKIGQMTQIERAVSTASVIQQYGIGSILNGGGSAPAPRASAEAWADMIDGFQNAALGTRLGVPIIYGVDAVHGHNNVFGATIFPHNIGLGATRDPELVKRIGAATALEVRATGIPYAFAPCIAVSRDPRWGRCYESFGEETELVQGMTSAILGLQGDVPDGHPPGMPFVAAGGSNVAACAKHFVGDGGTVEGIDENNTMINMEGLKDIHMAPYVDALAKGVSTVMISYSSWNGQKMHSNQYLVTDVLKQQMGFMGFTISDWEGIDRITSPPDSNYSYSVLAAVNAGIDMVMVPFEYERFIAALTAHVNSGAIPQERIDDAVRRILRVKFIAGLFEQPLANRSLTSMVGHPEHRKLAREAVRKSVVLLKNGKAEGSPPLLPLNRNAAKILVAGTHASNMGYQCGGWSIEWQGAYGDITPGTTILEAISNAVSPTTQVVFQECPDPSSVKDQGYSYALVVVGEAPYAEIAGDSLNLTIPSQGIQIIQNVCGSVQCAVVLISGRPLVIEPYLPLMDALVAAWLPGSEGQGIADVLFGDYDFQGKLPRTWFRSVDQLPMNVGDANYDPLFPYGFGLRINK